MTVAMSSAKARIVGLGSDFSIVEEREGNDNDKDRS